MVDRELTASPVETARKLADHLEQKMTTAQWMTAAEGIQAVHALRALLATTREDNAPETIAHEVIARRYGDYGTFEHALRSEPPHPLGFLNMLKDAAAAGLDSRDEF